jgi:hypothetical protein
VLSPSHQTQSNSASELTDIYKQTLTFARKILNNNDLHFSSQNLPASLFRPSHSQFSLTGKISHSLPQIFIVARSSREENPG